MNDEIQFLELELFKLFKGVLKKKRANQSRKSERQKKTPKIEKYIKEIKICEKKICQIAVQHLYFLAGSFLSLFQSGEETIQFNF